MSLAAVFFLCLVITLAAIFYVVFGQKRRNWFEFRGRYKDFNRKWLPTNEQWEAVDRPTSLDGELTIPKGSGDIAAFEPLTVPQVFIQTCAKHRDKPALAYQVSNDSGGWDDIEISFEKYEETAHLFSRALIGLGFQPHDVINIIGHNCPNWFFAQMGAILAGGVCSGLYPTSYPGSITYIANHCEARFAFVDSRPQLEKFLEIEGSLEHLEYLICWDTSVDLQSIETKRVRLLSLDQFLSHGENVPQTVVEERIQDQRPGQCCLLSYTSGTTGNPKAVMLCHDNILFCLASGMSCLFPGQYFDVCFPPKSQLRIVSYLPLNHLAGLMTEFFNPLFISYDRDVYFTVYFSRSDWKKTLFETIQWARPTNVIGVPRIFEKITEGIKSRVAASSFIKRSLFNFAFYIGKKLYNNFQANGSGEYPIGYEFVHRIVFKKILTQLGLQNAVSVTAGGAPLSEATKEFFGAMGIMLGNAYGMTETCAIGATARENFFVSGAVGIVSSGVEMRIEHEEGRDPKDHGEICIRSRGVMMGYLKDPVKTHETIDQNGWLHTGDVGKLDGQVLYITGRIKELIIGAGGENVAPVPIEQYVTRIRPGVAQIVVVGDERKYLAALVAVATETNSRGEPSNVLMGHAKAVNSTLTRVEEMKNDETWIEYVRSGFREYNENQDVCVSRASRIQRFCFLDEMLSQSQGTLGPTLKTKRHVIREKFADLIDSLYNGEGYEVNA